MVFKPVIVTVCHDDQPDEVAEKFIKALKKLKVSVVVMDGEDDVPEIQYRIEREER